jgi:signal transduction histidine kinase
MANSSTTAALPNRSTFRQRLLLTIGSALAVALAGLAGLIWLGAYAWFNHTAHQVLRAETEHVLAQVVGPGGTLHADAYAWNEPHHLFRGEHVDPFFLQVFNADGELVRASENIAAFPDDAYPEQLLDKPTPPGRSYAPLRTVQVEDTQLYYMVRPIRNAEGTPIGIVQLARRDPGLQQLHRRLAFGLGGGLLVVLMGLGALIWWVAGRVLRPLETITEATKTISADALNTRITVPAESDRETAQLAATLNTLLDRLETAFDEMRRFTASAAHELKTPLTVLQGHVDVTLRRPREAEDYRETLQLARRKISHLIAMVQGLLTLARIDRADQPDPEATVDLAQLVRSEAPTFRAAVAERDVAFVVNAPESVSVAGAPEMLREVVTNLLDNAVKYTRQGRIEVTVRLHDPETAALVVSDTGVGMTEDEQAQATDRFFRAASMHATQVDGSGLGLSLVDQIVRWHGGTLHIESAPEQGTTVTVQLLRSSEAP